MLYQRPMKTNTATLGRAREQVDTHVPIVVGAALKLAMAGPTDPDDTRARIDSCLTDYHWEMHSSRVKRLADTLRAILPPA